MDSTLFAMAISIHAENCFSGAALRTYLILILIVRIQLLTYLVFFFSKSGTNYNIQCKFFFFYWICFRKYWGSMVWFCCKIWIRLWRRRLQECPWWYYLNYLPPHPFMCKMITCFMFIISPDVLSISGFEGASRSSTASLRDSIHGESFVTIQHASSTTPQFWWSCLIFGWYWCQCKIEQCGETCIS